MQSSDIVPDDKDWTWVLAKGCPDCGFTPHIETEQLAGMVRETIPVWREALSRSRAHRRPSPTTWSPLEYGCHVRDVCLLFHERLQLMLTHDGAEFANWDQDETAVVERYHEQDPAAVAREYAVAAEALAAAFDAVTGDQWQRRGIRSNGSEFTVATFGVYLLHDLVHHGWDVAATG